MRKEPYGFGLWMKAELINKRTTRWVEFIAKVAQTSDKDGEGWSKDLGQRDEVRNLHALGDSENGNGCDSSETQVSVSRKILSNFEELAAHVMSKQTSIGNLANIPIQSQPDIQPSLKNQKPLNQLLNLTALNSITLMETDLQEKSRSLTTKSLEHHTTSPLNIPTTNNTSTHISSTRPYPHSFD